MSTCKVRGQNELMLIIIITLYSLIIIMILLYSTQGNK